MPELPEVETVRRGLTELVVGKTVKDVIVRYPQIITNDVQDFKEKLKNQKLEAVNRRGKYLIFKFTDYDMLSHLRMEGKYQLVDSLNHLDKHSHVIFHMTDDALLSYRDVRKFGRMTLYDKDEAVHSKSIMQLGPEPTEKDFDVNLFSDNLQKYHKAIKLILLEQKVVTGLGNIYVDEVLFKSGIHPLRAANSLSKQETKVLHDNIISTLDLAIKHKGTTIRSYENAFGENGNYQNYLEVYGQDGEPCPHCGTMIEKIKVGGRGTHFCPNCQQLGDD